MPLPTSSAADARHASRFLAATLAAALGSLVLAQGQPPPQAPPAAQGQQGQAPAGQAQPPQGQVPTFRAEANFVRVDVYPTAGGKPVTDLRQDEFELLEDNAPQKIQTFEHVVVRAATALDEPRRAEPNTVEQSREMAAESKARLFVLYLDTYHISRSGAMNVRAALIRFLQRALGPDDMVAVTTPELPASTVTFARRSGSIEELVDKFYGWSRRDAITEYDPIEEQYMQCYPPAIGEMGRMSAIAREMIQRRRERVTLDSLQELVVHLGGLREERKAVLAVSEGWLLYQQNTSLTNVTAGQTFGGSPFQARCDADRYRLSQEDDARDFRNMLDEANRANVSFYPIDPRGLVVFDASPGDELVDLATDASRVSARLASLQDLAASTDGLAIVNSNDIDRGLRRVIDDMTSYYLLGYYSTNTKLDGKYRSIKVRVKRPGADVRARRGYRAATREEVASRVASTSAAGSPAAPILAAVSNLGKIRADAAVQAQAGYGWAAGADGAAQPTLWLAGEWDPSIGTRDEQWKNGADVTVTVTAPDKASLSTLQKTLTRESRSFTVRVPVPAGQTAGDYTVRISTKPAGTTLGTTETLHVVLPKRPAAGALAVGQPALFRRGPFTGPAWQAAGDVRFRRQERVRVDVGVLGPAASGAVRLLDRAGHALSLPVTVGERDEDGGRVVSGEVALAPLSVGDYVLETTITQGTTTQTVLAAFRIVP
jgi:VWFA-related protein